MAIDVVIPALGLTVEKGSIVKWLKDEGDTVAKGDPLFEVETDKVTIEVESPASGILAKILIPVGVEVPILTVVAVITGAGEELPEEYMAEPKYLDSLENGAINQSERDHVAGFFSKEPTQQSGPVRIVPAARRLARERNLRLENITGSGPDGVMLVRDVEAAFKTEVQAPVRATPLARKVAGIKGVPLEQIRGTGIGGRIRRADVDQAIKDSIAPRLGTVIPMSTMRRAISHRLSESSLTAPHVYFFTDVWMEPLLSLRANILPDFEKKYGLRLSVNDFLIKAVALNILEFPILNATVKGDEIQILPEINVCLAVALPDGLIVPSIINADRAGLSEIARQRQDLVQRAQSAKLTIEELERGTFTISSLAQYDIISFTAILNPPQSGILSIGKIREELAMVDGEIKAKKMSTFGLGVDHRIIDGAVAADFLQNLKWKIERPFPTFLGL